MILGEIVRADLGSGLQSQTYNLCKMLKPNRLLVVDSTSFNNRKQYPEMYDGFERFTSRGFPTNLDCTRFMRGLSHIITAETIYNPKMYALARMRGVKVYTQLNWEFLDHIHTPHLPKPHMWLMPSYWHLEDMQALFPNTIYLPPPLFMNDFKDVRAVNLNRTGRRRFVHIMGHVASHDRNGTFDLIEAMKHSSEDFELVIRSQDPIEEYMSIVSDSRIRFDIGQVNDTADMYRDFDAMIMPRRYGGLCLPMNEALASGLPVIMPDISPNNKVLPEMWLVEADKKDEFMARTIIDIHECDPEALGRALDYFSTIDDIQLQNYKLQASDIAHDNYSSDILRPKYMEVFSK